MKGRPGKWMAAALVLSALSPGRPWSEIVGGHNISIKDAPYQMLFRIDGSGVCGAAWLGGRWAATAAHCVEGASASGSYVYAGITRFNEAGTSNRIPIKQIIENPDNNGISRDLALLELNADVTSPLAKPIRYATAADATAGLTAAGVWCNATGWGKLSASKGLADSLQLVESKVYNSSQAYVIQWAGAGSGSDIGSCQGDSGGPLVVKDKSGNLLLAGISSYIQSFCGDPKNPSSYSRVSAIAYFIAKYVPQSPVGIQAPGQDDALFFPRPDRFRLARAQRVDLTYMNLAGVVLASDRGYFAAGEHVLSTGNMPAGRYLIRLRGDQGEFFGQVNTAR